MRPARGTALLVLPALLVAPRAEPAPVAQDLAQLPNADRFAAAPSRSFVSPGAGDDLVGIVGSYEVTGVHAEGNAYTGTGTVSRVASHIYKMSWDTSPGKTFYGLVLRRGDLLLGGWGYQENQRAAVYRIDGKTLDGVTLEWSSPHVGHELLTGGDLQQTTTFTIANGVDPDGKAYSGTLTSKMFPKDVRSLEWQLGAKSYRGFGIVEGSDFIVGYDDNGEAAPVRYRIESGGRKLVGVFLDPKYPALGLGTETMTRSD